MPSPRRDHRSRSASHSPDPSTKSKRSLDLVSTRRFSPPFHQNHNHGYRGRGRGRPMRRPFVRRGPYGTTIYRGNSQRYYPRHDRREDNRYYRRSYSRDRSESHERHRKSRSFSSSSDSSFRERSRSVEKRKLKSKAHSRSSVSPDDRPTKKKARRRSDDSSEHAYKERSSSMEEKASRSKSREGSSKRSEKKKAKEEGKKKKERKFKEEPSVSPDNVKPQKKLASTATVAGRGKDAIPRNRLNKIFTLISQDSNFELDEDISIAIQRNPYAEPSDESTVTVVFDDTLFSMIYPYEGRKHHPIFDREEIKMFGHDKNLADDPDFERRVIRVKPGKASARTESSESSARDPSYKFSSSLEITRTVNRERSRSSSSGRSGSHSPVIAPETKFRLRLSSDPRFESQYSETSRKEESGSSRHAELDPSDLRHELRKSGERNRLDRREDRNRSTDSRDRPDEKKEKEELPDYSRRKDKYQYTPWLIDQPESTPKDPKYFLTKQSYPSLPYHHNFPHSQHDDRDNRGRGRGMFRGQRGFRRPFRPFRSRGLNFRGNFRARGNYYNNNSNSGGGGGRDRSPRSPRRTYSSSYGENRSYEREWKHDKFSELEHEDGEKKAEGGAQSSQASMEHPHSTSER